MHFLPQGAFALLCVTVSAKAATFTVLVGSSNTLTFDPALLTGVSNGDTVNFQFVSGNHSVVQSTFSAPCTAAGISSGFQNVPDPDALDFPTWSPIIVDAEDDPLFFFCSQVTATSTHCQQGMVFVINSRPAVGQSFPAFQQAAIAMNGTGPQNPPGTIISGTPGATISNVAIPSAATLLPSLPAVSIISTTLSTSAPTSTLTTNITPSSASTTSSATTTDSAPVASSARATPVGPIVGGVVAALVLLITVGLFVFIRIRRRKAVKTESLIYLTNEDMPPDIPLTPWTITAFPQMESLASSNKLNPPRKTAAALENKTRREEPEGGRDLALERPRPHPTESTDAAIPSPDIPQEEDPAGQPPYAVQEQGEIPNDLTEEEGALLRELQIIRRLEEIRIGDVVPPPEYELTSFWNEP
ncbi:hypothetical protein BDP27DRAFT_1426114 [Rhodocollybia butyracea]|uniref:Extracellular serine-rich protein n=1 Tax=Rhodocollybia butyracea TaxID=206335 RepID=A0A9P5U2Q7_9AGAR|nr:hypothetical protein BDP27DRAFT_1426114 [Rhodocollybia butyracea]